MEFVAIDVETANSKVSSICQIGLALYTDGVLASTWASLINPNDFFDPMNVSIHGIDEHAVRDAPTISQVKDRLYDFLNGRTAVCHTHFDRIAITRSAEENSFIAPSCIWLDSARVARRAWEEFSWSGYGLANVCECLGYEFRHHDALEDAKAAAYILLKAIEKTGLSLEEWRDRIKRPISSRTAEFNSKGLEGNPDGAHFGERLVFTGGLRIARIEAAEKAASVGFQVDRGVTRHTNVLVVGDQDIDKLAGYQKSTKHRKAEELIKKGYDIRILRETDFARLCTGVE